MTTIAIVRHGNTDWNIEKRAQGHANNSLNELGFKQAKIVGRRLSKENWDVMISSDLLRARQTAEIISSHIKKPITQFDKRLRERDRGEIEGTVEEERIKRWGVGWRKLELKQENDLSMRERGVHFVKDMTKQFPMKKILVVSHGAIMKQTLKGLFNDMEYIKSLDNTSVTVIREKEGTWSNLLYNCTCHLNTEDISL